MSMQDLRPHEELLADDLLEEFHESKGNVMFVSHQWAGLDHPDPNFEQFKVLQDALKNAKVGATTISGNVSVEIYAGQQSYVSPKEFSSKPLFVWYDFFCCPQSHDGAANRKLAIDSIPVYVDTCKYFVILCPHVHHAQRGELLSRGSWERRGWCRRGTRKTKITQDQKTFAQDGTVACGFSLALASLAVPPSRPPLVPASLRLWSGCLVSPPIAVTMIPSESYCSSRFGS